MGNFFGRPKMVKAPQVKPLPPIPTVDEEVGDIARKRKRRGRQGTFIVGDLVSETEREMLLKG